MTKRPFFFLYIAFVIVLSTGCDRRSSVIMDRAEALMTDYPDSSLFLLEQIPSEELCTARTKARYALLKTMALDKNYMDMADDSLSRMAYDYYQYHGSTANRMKSTYYLGVIEENGENLIDAAIHFKEAETLAEQLQDNHFLGLSCQHLSGIFARNYDHNEALKYARKAKNAFDKANEIISAWYSGIDEAKQYRLLGEIPQAHAILDSLRSLYFPSKEQLSYYFSQKGELYYLTKQFDKAHEFFNLAISDNYTLPKAFLGDLAVTEEMIGNHTVADSLLEVLGTRTRSQIDSITLLNTKHNISFLRGDYNDAYDYMIAATKLQDKAVIMLLNQSVAHTFQSYYEDKFQLAKEKANTRLFVILLIVSMLVSLTFVTVHLIRKKNKQLMREMSIIDDIKTDLIRLQDRNKDLGTVIYSLMQDKINVMQQLSETYFQWSDDSIASREKREGKILKEDAISQFRYQIRQLRGDTHFLEDIEKALDDSNNGIMKRLRSNITTLGDHTLKEIDYNLLTLLFAGFPIKSISFLMNMTESSVRTRKTRYKQWFQKRDDADSKKFAQWLS